MVRIVLLCFSLIFTESVVSENGTFPIRMPEITPVREEVYLCTSVHIGPDSRYWITGFIPIEKTKGTIHHMSVIGCSRTPPVTPKNVWNCGANGNPALEPGYPDLQRQCSRGDTNITTLFLWSRGGKSIHLPLDTGFAVGGPSPIQHLVLQIHYVNVGMLSKDVSGIDLLYTDVEQPKSAGMLSVHVTTKLPPLSKSFQDGACHVAENKVLHPLAFLVHTHAHGQVVSTWRVRRRPQNRQDEWTLIGKKSPLEAQSFYPVEDPRLTIRRNDSVAIRCSMINLGTNEIRQGLASYDEMCDMYMLYWVDGDHTNLLQGPGHCVSSGPPVTWSSYGFNNLPDAKITSIP